VSAWRLGGTPVTGIASAQLSTEGRSGEAITRAAATASSSHRRRRAPRCDQDQHQPDRDHRRGRRVTRGEREPDGSDERRGWATALVQALEERHAYLGHGPCEPERDRSRHASAEEQKAPRRAIRRGIVTIPAPRISSAFIHARHQIRAIPTIHPAHRVVDPADPPDRGRRRLPRRMDPHPDSMNRSPPTKASARIDAFRWSVSMCSRPPTTSRGRLGRGLFHDLSAQLPLARQIQYVKIPIGIWMANVSARKSRTRPRSARARPGRIAVRRRADVRCVDHGHAPPRL